MKRERNACPRKVSQTLCAIAVILAGFGLSPHMYAQETILDSLTGSDGAQPTAGLTPDGAGNYYGTTLMGGTSGFGTVFELSPNSSGGWTETVLYNFTNGTDGGQPASGVVRDASGNLYGTTEFGGGGCTGGGCGVAFKLSKQSSGWTETVLHAFTGGSDGGAPNGVILDARGRLYGSAGVGGASGNGVVFELSRNASGVWSETVIYSFTGGTFGGRNPSGNLVFDSSGRLYGATLYSGAGGGGIVFRLTPSQSGVWSERLIHNFTGYSDGSVPNGGLVLDSAGNIYGTAQAGGNAAYCNHYGCGVVFKLSPQAGGGWDETALYIFTGGTDGGAPLAGPAIDSAGNLYGTTSQGGNASFCGGQGGCGVVFEISPGATGYTESVLHEFTNGPDGAFPGAGLTRDASGNLLGTTFAGGVLSDCSGSGCGVIFEVAP